MDLARHLVRQQLVRQFGPPLTLDATDEELDTRAAAMLVAAGIHLEILKPLPLDRHATLVNKVAAVFAEVLR